MVIITNLIAGAVLAAWAGWWLYDLGKVHGVNELGGLRSEHRTLQTLYDKAISERNKLRDRVAILERSSQVDRQAAQDVREELGALQEELQAAREEIKFYRGIVSPADGVAGLRVGIMADGTADRVQVRSAKAFESIIRNLFAEDGTLIMNVAGMAITASVHEEASGNQVLFDDFIDDRVR